MATVQEQLQKLESYRKHVNSDPMPNASEQRQLHEKEADFRDRFNISTSSKSLGKFHRIGILPQEDYIDDDGKTWVAEYDKFSMSGICWEVLKK